MKLALRFLGALVALVVFVLGVYYFSGGVFSLFARDHSATQNEGVRIEPSSDIVQAARSQLGQTLRYDPSYQAITYPMGDVPLDRGVCTDVVIRALRDARDLDLQELIHEDMKRHFDAYPKKWGLSAPDSNIDHRRVPNIRRYLERMGYELPVSSRGADYLPGDIVSSDVLGRPHIMIVSDKKSFGGRPYVIHNIGAGTQEEDVLFYYPLTGHYRISQ